MYEIGIFGCFPASVSATLARTIEDMVADFGLVVGHDVLIHDASSIAGRNFHSPFAAIYYGGPNRTQDPIIHGLLRDSIPIIPTIDSSGSIDADIPPSLRHLNIFRRRDDDPQMTSLVSALLECVGLLRPQRRVFLSYRRTEAHVAASQLHDQLTARGFDVFLDTHELRPAEPFQEILWHRLCDSDVMLMLETPTYFSSKWTRHEFGRTLAKNIHILRVVWPDLQPDSSTGLATSVYLEPTDLEGPVGPLVDHRVNAIAIALERLRARSLAARHRAINGQLRIELEKIHATIEGVGRNQAISVRLADDRRIYAYPIVGIPTAELLHEVEKKARMAGLVDPPALVYDHVGIRDTWNDHLQWLDTHIGTVRAIKVAEAAWSLAVWES